MDATTCSTSPAWMAMHARIHVHTPASGNASSRVLALGRFFARLPAEVRNKLDYSVESLDVLEAWLLARYPDSEQTSRAGEATVIDGAARYIGETFCKVLDGRWWVDTVHDTFHGWPQVTGFRTGPGSDSPLSMATACTNRRRGNFISSILRKQLAKLPEPKPS